MTKKEIDNIKRNAALLGEQISKAQFEKNDIEAQTLCNRAFIIEAFLENVFGEDVEDVFFHTRLQSALDVAVSRSATK